MQKPDGTFYHGVFEWFPLEETVVKYEYFYKEVLLERIRYMDDFWQDKDFPHIPFEVSCWIGDIQNITYLPAMLNQWLTYFNANIPYPGYFIPNFWLYYGNTVCAEMFGAKTHRDPPRQPIAIPFIKDDSQKCWIPAFAGMTLRV